MPKYSSYPLITSLAGEDVILVHDDSANAEKLITFDNFVLSIPDVTQTTAGLMLGADKLKLDSATQSNTASTLVLRDTLGRIAVGNINVTKALGGDGGVSLPGSLRVGSMVFSGGDGDIECSGGLISAGASEFHDSIDVTNGVTAATIEAGTSIASLGTLAAAGQFIGGFQLGDGFSNSRITKWHWHSVSQVFVGGAPSETFDINIAGTGFSSKPDLGFLMAYNPSYLATWQITSGSSTATNAHCELVRRDGTNIAAGTYAMAALFVKFT